MQIHERVYRGGCDFARYDIHNLSAGDKRLRLDIVRYNFLASTYFYATGARRIPGATTELYKIVSERIQQASNQDRKPIEYKFLTRDKKLSAWALSRGQEIFVWENVDTNDSGLLICTRLFVPQTSAFSP